MRPRIYIAAPYTKGNIAVNVRAAINAWHELWVSGYAPFCPHLCHFLELQKALDYTAWLEYDFIWVRQCHALIRLPGESEGADQEVALASNLGKPIFYTLESAKHACETIRAGGFGSVPIERDLNQSERFNGSHTIVQSVDIH
jgi:hypothetical protein